MSGDFLFTDKPETGSVISLEHALQRFPFHPWAGTKNEMESGHVNVRGQEKAEGSAAVDAFENDVTSVLTLGGSAFPDKLP